MRRWLPFTRIRPGQDTATGSDTAKAPGSAADRSTGRRTPKRSRPTSSAETSLASSTKTTEERLVVSWKAGSADMRCECGVPPTIDVPLPYERLLMFCTHGRWHDFRRAKSRTPSPTSRPVRQGKPSLLSPRSNSRYATLQGEECVLTDASSSWSLPQPYPVRLASLHGVRSVKLPDGCLIAMPAWSWSPHSRGSGGAR